MATEIKREVKLEIVHVLFLDIVGYSKSLTDEQQELIDRLNQVVRGSDEFQKAASADRLIKIPTGDGMALIFYNSPEQPVNCALEISRALKSSPLPVRMGVHSGPVSAVTDLNNRTNAAGMGINVAQRIMDCGDTGHILLSKRVAEDLQQYSRWRPHLHDLGEVEVKHGERVHVFNFYTDDAGNSDLPKKVIGAAVQSRRVTAPPAKKPAKSERPSICVLPFANMSGDPEQEYFSDGISEDIITDLSKISALHVVSRNTAFTFKGKAVDVGQVASQLKVSHVVEGSVRKAAGRVRITAQLIDGANDSHLWAERYDRDLNDIFAIQDEISRAIVDALKVKLLPEEEKAIEQRGTENVDAYNLFLMARQSFRHWFRRRCPAAMKRSSACVAARWKSILIMLKPGRLSPWRKCACVLPWVQAEVAMAAWRPLNELFHSTQIWPKRTLSKQGSCLRKTATTKRLAKSKLLFSSIPNLIRSTDPLPF